MKRIKYTINGIAFIGIKELDFRIELNVFGKGVVSELNKTKSSWLEVSQWDPNEFNFFLFINLNSLIFYLIFQTETNKKLMIISILFV